MCGSSRSLFFSRRHLAHAILTPTPLLPRTFVNCLACMCRYEHRRSSCVRSGDVHEHKVVVHFWLQQVRLACPPTFCRFSSNQVDSFLMEERRSIDEAEEYLVGRSALADRNKGTSTGTSASDDNEDAPAADREKAGIRSSEDGPSS